MMTTGIKSKHESKRKSYAPTDCPLKQEIREKLDRFISESSLKTGIVLVLTYPGCYDCTLIHSSNKKLRFQAVERDRETYKELCNFIASNKLRYMLPPIKADIGDVVRRSGSDQWSHGFLDMCDTLSSNIECLKNALSNDIFRKGSIIGITMNTREANVKINLRLLVNKYGRGKYDIFPEIARYNDSSPMLTMFIQRTL